MWRWWTWITWGEYCIFHRTSEREKIVVQLVILLLTYEKDLFWHQFLNPKEPGSSASTSAASRSQQQQHDRAVLTRHNHFGRHYWKLVNYHFWNPIFALNLLITNFNFRTKIYGKKHCETSLVLEPRQKVLISSCFIYLLLSLTILWNLFSIQDEMFLCSIFLHFWNFYSSISLQV